MFLKYQRVVYIIFLRSQTEMFSIKFIKIVIKSQKKKENSPKLKKKKKNLKKVINSIKGVDKNT